jgi:hypothetical protein
MRILSIAALLVFVGSAAAEEKKLTGSWSKKADEQELKIVFLKDNMLQFSISHGDDGCVVDAKYTVDGDGVLKCELTKFEKKGNFPVEKGKGYKFSFKAEMKDKVVKLTQFDGDEISDDAKAAIEGDYEKVAD